MSRNRAVAASPTAAKGGDLSPGPVVRRRHPYLLAVSALAMLGWILFLMWMAFRG